MSLEQQVLELLFMIELMEFVEQLLEQIIKQVLMELLLPQENSSQKLQYLLSLKQ